VQTTLNPTRANQPTPNQPTPNQANSTSEPKEKPMLDIPDFLQRRRTPPKN
jgi:cell division protein FtsZ